MLQIGLVSSICRDLFLCRAWFSKGTETPNPWPTSHGCPLPMSSLSFLQHNSTDTLSTEVLGGALRAFSISLSLRQHGARLQHASCPSVPLCVPRIIHSVTSHTTAGNRPGAQQTNEVTPGAARPPKFTRF